MSRRPDGEEKLARHPQADPQPAPSGKAACRTAASYDVLVLSGGGSDGAYGAGLLNGWTARGDRPEFGLVTGISTGALIAPFAFLGPDYDDELERLYTTTRTEDLVEFNVCARSSAGRSG